MAYSDHSIQLIPEGTAIFNSKGKMNGRNTWKTWHLVPNTRPLANPPGVKTNYVDLPGANGSIDATTVLTTWPVYNNRGMSQEFYVMNEYYGTGSGTNGARSWDELYTNIMEYCHGRNMKVILLDDRSYYYFGRVGVNTWKSEKDWSKIVLDFNLEPFKYELFSSTEDWLWDPFKFEGGIIRNPSDYKNVTISYQAGSGSGRTINRTKEFYEIYPDATEETMKELSNGKGEDE